ncbi:MAG: hypothetical protein IPN86_04565 [Saprospiraceae bacterium]|nr:hypothetical protein [Saprospiraceae bacterium]
MYLLFNDNEWETSQTYRVTEDKSKPTLSVTAQDLSQNARNIINSCGQYWSNIHFDNNNQTIQNGYKITNP